MPMSNVATVDELGRARALPADFRESKPVLSASAVSWGAIVAGAAAAAALSLILLILGTGLGLSSVSPWAHDGVSASTFGLSTILWVTLTQLAASAMGGYLAGRLRTKWVEVHKDEIYFRDTAHGFLAWAIASLASAVLLTSVIGSILSGGTQAGATVAGSVATTAMVGTAAGAAGVVSEMTKANADSAPFGYFVDSLFRKEINNTTAGASAPAGNDTTSGSALPQDSAAAVPEVTRIFLNTMRTGPLAADDLRYVGQLVAQRTGLPQAEAEKRVNDTYVRAQAKLRDAEIAAKDVADKARKTSAYAALWLFISLLAGAFIASVAATYGGRRRDA